MILVWTGLAIALCSLGYVACAILAVRAFGARLARPVPAPPPEGVTLLKPLCGEDPELLDNLRSCCRQDHPRFQVVFGVLDANDPAAEVARQVIREHPNLDLSLVAGAEPVGPNLKISSLVHMQRKAKHEVICVADSDMRVGPDYLTRIMGPFDDPAVGAVTCLYTGQARNGLWSRLGAMFINDWFLPSALVSGFFLPLRYCFGATMALRRDALNRMGGFQALAHYLADDYILGRRVCEQGYRIALADCTVSNLIHEPDLFALLQHELRWARTMRRVEPLGFGLAVLTDVLPLTALLSLLVYLGTEAAGPALTLLALGLLARLVLHHTVVRTLGVQQGACWWLIPLRDLLTASMRLWSFVPGPVSWRGHDFDVDGEGRLIPRAPETEPADDRLS